MKDKIVIVFDCGATNVRAIAVNGRGQIVAGHSLPNIVQPDPYFPDGLIWDVDEIWNKFTTCVKSVLNQIDKNDVGAVTVTTFGVNGAPVDKAGNLLYPVISWQCQRTAPIMNHIDKYIPLSELYKISGINKFSFNTINTLLWIKENRPDILDKMEGFLFITSIFIHKLTGELINDATMAGTSMLTDIKTRTFSEEILEKTGLPNRFFKILEAGETAGKLSDKASKELGIPAGIPVVVGGHDTQMALVGSGAGKNEPVLSSGTWEILMTRASHVELNDKTLNAGFTNELDAVPGLYTPGAQWIGSGMLEWIKKRFYSREFRDTPDDIYDIMIEEASEVNPKDLQVKINPDFATGEGVISGLGMHSSRKEIYRAALESLAERTKEYLELLEEAGKFKADSIIAVGGGSKNQLWNQIRANKLGIPVKLAKQTETTVLGAAMFAHVAIGSFNSLTEAANEICRDYEAVEPE